MSEVVANAVKALEDMAKLNNATWWAFADEIQKSPMWPEIKYRFQRLMEDHM